MYHEMESVGIKIKLMLFNKIKLKSVASEMKECTGCWEGRVGKGEEEELEERNGG